MKAFTAGSAANRPVRVEPLEGRLLFAADSSVFDPNFGGGQAQIPFTTLASTVQSDGKVLVVGTSDYSASSFTTFGLVPGSLVVVERFGTDGLPDPTFNGGQPLHLDPSGNDSLGINVFGPSEATTVTTDALGRILVSGLLLNEGVVNQSNGNGDLLVPFVLRVTPDGQRDSTFNAPVGGLHDFNYNSPTEVNNAHFVEYPYSIVVTNSGNVVVAGTSNLYNLTTFSNFNEAFLRSYTDNGTPDRTFTTPTENQAGLVTYNAPNLYDAFGVHAVYAPAEDAIYLGNTSITPLAPFLFKVSAATGATAPGFNFDNNFSYQPGQSGGSDDLQYIAVQPDGKIVVAGVSGASSTASLISGGDAFGLARFLPDGTLDPTFGNNGVVAETGFSNAQVRGLEIQPDGQIDIAATADYQSANVAFLGAFNSDGTLDTGFGTGGVAVQAITPIASSGLARPDAAQANPSSLGAAQAAAARAVHPFLSTAEFFISLSATQNPDGTSVLSESDPSQNVSVLRRVRFDHVAPQALISPGPDITAAGVATYTFTMAYTDNDRLDGATVGNGNVVVTGPNGYTQAATLVGTSGSGRSLTATYQVTAPHGTWSSADNGTYTIALQGGQVTDMAGNAALPVSAQFQVNEGASGPLTPAEQVAADQAKLAGDTQAQRDTLTADARAAASTAAADKATISADKAQIKADRHNPSVLAQDKARLAADQRQARANAAAAKAKIRLDKVNFANLIKADKAKLKADQRLLKQSR